MSLDGTPRPVWLTFDCYGTLIQWDEGLVAAVRRISGRHGAKGLDPRPVVPIYDRAEYDLERGSPHKRYDVIAAESLTEAMKEVGVECDADDTLGFVAAIPEMIPFAEVPSALRDLKNAGFKLCIISNTTDNLIAGNVAQFGHGVMDRVITAEQANAYKPDHRLFEYAWRELGVERSATCHICASPKLDHTAARDLGFRCVWIDRGTGRKPLDDYAPDLTLQTLDEVPETFRLLGWM